jgi:hypothetical protein
MNFFAYRVLYRAQRWIETMDWKNAFQIEARPPNTQDLLRSLQKPIEDVTRDYRSEASELLRLFSVELKIRPPDEDPKDCLAHVRSSRFGALDPGKSALKPLKLAPTSPRRHHSIAHPSAGPLYNAV